MKYKYKCNTCGIIIETELYYSDEYPKENSLLGLGLYHSDLEVCDTNGNVLGSWNFPALAEMIRENEKTIRVSICDGIIVSAFPENVALTGALRAGKQEEKEMIPSKVVEKEFEESVGSEPDLLVEALKELKKKVLIPKTKIAYFKCGCEEFIDRELPHSLFRMCNEHHEKFIESLELDCIYSRTRAN